MRNLTTGEVAMLQKVFGNSINYAEVTIGSYQLASPGVTLNNSVIIDAEDNLNPKTTQYHDDFSTASSKDQALLFHEMTHVWQAQHGYPVLPIGFALQAIKGSGIVNPPSFPLSEWEWIHHHRVYRTASTQENRSERDILLD